MRLVAGVVTLVVCVHAGLWALLRDESTPPNVEAPLASVSFSPYHGSNPPAPSKVEWITSRSQLR